MTRYYFDIRDGASFCADDEGTELEGQKAARVEAAMTLADIAKAVAESDENQRIAIDVRTADGLVFKATLLIEIALADLSSHN